MTPKPPSLLFANPACNLLRSSLSAQRKTRCPLSNSQVRPFFLHSALFAYKRIRPDRKPKQRTVSQGVLNGESAPDRHSVSGPTSGLDPGFHSAFRSKPTLNAFPNHRPVPPISTSAPTPSLFNTFLRPNRKFTPEFEFKCRHVMMGFLADASKPGLLAACEKHGLKIWDQSQATVFLQFVLQSSDIDSSLSHRVLYCCAELGHQDSVLLVSARILASSWTPNQFKPEILERLRACTKTVPVAQVLWGIYVAMDKNWAEAERFIRDAIQKFTFHDVKCLDFLKVSVWTTLGSILRCMGPEREEEAYAAFKRAVVEQADPVAMYLLGRTIADFEIPFPTSSAPPKDSISSNPQTEPGVDYPVGKCNREWFEYTLQAASVGEVKSAFALGVFYLEATPAMMAKVDGEEIKQPVVEDEPNLQENVSAPSSSAASWIDSLFDDPDASMASILTEPSRFATVPDRLLATMRRFQGRPDFETFARERFGESWLIEAAKASYPPAIRYLALRQSQGKALANYSSVLQEGLQNMRPAFENFYQADFDNAVRLIHE